MSNRAKCGDNWRVSYDKPDGTRIHVERAGNLDEVTLDNWLHLERMDTRAWWLQVGDARIWVKHPYGQQVIVGIERGEYGPVRGDTYAQNTIKQTVKGRQKL